MANDFVSGDTASVLRATLTDSAGAVVDVTGMSIALKWENATGDAIVSKQMTIVDAAAGVVEYKFTTGELYAPKMKFEIEATTSLSEKITGLDLINVTVREQMS